MFSLFANFASMKWRDFVRKDWGVADELPSRCGDGLLIGLGGGHLRGYCFDFLAQLFFK
jgi:hypothetical protein